MSYVSTQDLEFIRKLVFEKNVEVCGFLLTHREQENLKKHKDRRFLIPHDDRKMLMTFIDSIGIDLTDRGFCQHTRYTKYIWHTHSHNLLPYPSAEDIVNMLKWHINNTKNDYPVSSVIFTLWGIWEIHSDKKYQLDQKWLEYLHYTVKQSIDKLYKNIENIELVIREISEKINKHIFNIQIWFTKWFNEPVYKIKS